MTHTEMENTLKKQYPKAELAVIDVTGSGSNFEVRMSNSAFDSSLSRIDKHKSIMGLFDEQLKSGEIHALSIKLF